MLHTQVMTEFQAQSSAEVTSPNSASHNSGVCAAGGHPAGSRSESPAFILSWIILEMVSMQAGAQLLLF